MQIVLISSCPELIAQEKLCSPGFPVGTPLHSQGKGQGQITVFRRVFDVLSSQPGTAKHWKQKLIFAAQLPLALPLPPFGTAAFPALTSAPSQTWTALSKCPPKLSQWETKLFLLKPALCLHGLAGVRMEFLKKSEQKNANFLPKLILVFTGIIWEYGDYR